MREKAVWVDYKLTFPLGHFLIDSFLILALISTKTSDCKGTMAFHFHQTKSDNVHSIILQSDSIPIQSPYDTLSMTAIIKVFAPFIHLENFILIDIQIRHASPFTNPEIEEIEIEDRRKNQ